MEIIKIDEAGCVHEASGFVSASVGEHEQRVIEHAKKKKMDDMIEARNQAWREKRAKKKIWEEEQILQMNGLTYKVLTGQV